MTTKQVLTDEQIVQLFAKIMGPALTASGSTAHLRVGRLIESAVLSALAVQEPVAYIISDPGEPDIGQWLSEEPAPADASWLKSEPLYRTPPAAPAAVQEAVAPEGYVEALSEAIRSVPRLPADDMSMDPPCDFVSPPAAPSDEGRPLAEWYEDHGNVVWWAFPVNEPAWIGKPIDDDWPGYHTHWTPHPPVPALAAQPAAPSDEGRAELVELVQNYFEAQDALDNREMFGPNAKPYEVLLRALHARRKELDAALAAQPAEVKPTAPTAGEVQR